MTPKFKLIKRSRSPYWLIRLDAPCADGWQERSTKQKRRRDAERVASRVLQEIGKTESRRITWKQFRTDYELDHLPNLRKPGCFKSSANKLEQLANPIYLDELTSAKLQKFRQQMSAAGMRSTTIASYLKHIRAALGWAADCGYIIHAPRVRTGSTAQMKGRPITTEEFERLLMSVSKVVGRQRSKGMKRLLEGLWLTGLRLQEALECDWICPEQIHPVNLDGKHPLLSFPARLQKNRKDQLVPLTPEAVSFLRRTPKSKRKGRLFPLEGPQGPIRSSDRASRLISAIGRQSRIITKTDPETGETRHVTAHDLRRSFATRLAKQVPADLLRELMRHADVKTTRTHYAEIDAEQLAEQLWKSAQ